MIYSTALTSTDGCDEPSWCPKKIEDLESEYTVVGSIGIGTIPGGICDNGWIADGIGMIPFTWRLRYICRKTCQLCGKNSHLNKSP